MKTQTSFLDLNSLDTRAIATMLREAALAQLSSLLAGALPRDLDPFLYSCAASLAERGHYTFGQVQFKPVFARAIGPSAAKEKVDEQLLHYMHVELGGNPPYRFPDVLWGVIEDWAWQDPEFMRAVDDKFLHYSAKNYLLVPGGAVQVSLAPQSYWLLIALAHSAVVSQSRLARFRRFLRRQLVAWWRGLGASLIRRRAHALPSTAMANAERMADASERLAHWAERRVMTNGWADFWDQWLVNRTRARWSKPFEHLSSEMKQALTHLPYLMREPLSSPDMPLDGGTLNPSQKVTFSKEEASSLAAANWLAREPLWMRTQVAANDDTFISRPAS